MFSKEYGLCQYRNNQKFVIQEMPETSSSGTMPRWIDAIAEGDLCGRVKTGDR